MPQSVTQVAEFGALRTAPNTSLPWCSPRSQPPEDPSTEWPASERRSADSACSSEHAVCIAAASPTTKTLYAHALADALTSSPELHGIPVVKWEPDGAPSALHGSFSFLSHVLRQVSFLRRMLPPRPLLSVCASLRCGAPSHVTLCRPVCPPRRRQRLLVPTGVFHASAVSPTPARPHIPDGGGRSILPGEILCGHEPYCDPTSPQSLMAV